MPHRMVLRNRKLAIWKILTLAKSRVVIRTHHQKGNKSVSIMWLTNMDSVPLGITYPHRHQYRTQLQNLYNITRPIQTTMASTDQINMTAIITDRTIAIIIIKTLLNPTNVKWIIIYILNAIYILFLYIVVFILN